MADVFISYSRRDSGFVHRLHDALSAENKDTWVDWQDIPPTAEWLEEIKSAIEGADSVIIVLSPDSVKSEICRQEIDHAAQHNKRLVPLVCRELDAKDAPDTLAKLNWIFFRESDSFDSSFQKLHEALEIDLDWVHDHTRLLVKALEWSGHNQEKSLLLSGADLKAAEDWLARSGQKEPAPTNTQTRYILFSQHARRRRQQLIAGTLAFGLAVAVVLASVAIYYSVVSERNRKVAVSRQLSTQALQITQSPSPQLGFYDRALLLAVEAGNFADTFEARDALLRVLQSDFHSKPFIRDRLGSFSNRVSDIAFSPDGRWIAAGCWDGNVTLWNRQDGQQRRVLRRRSGKRVHAVAFSPDSTLIATAHERGQIRIWEVSTGKLITEPPLVEHKGSVLGLAFNNDGTQLASAGDDNFVIVWDVATRKPGHEPLLGHEGPVRDLIFSPAGKRLASLGEDGTVWLWDIGMDPPSAKQLQLGYGRAISVAFSQDGILIATVHQSEGVKKLRLWDVMTGDALEHEALDGKRLGETAGRLADIRPDGKQFVSPIVKGEERKWQEAQLWDVTKGRSLINLRVPGREVKLSALSYGPEGEQLAIAVESAGYKSSVWLWDVRTRLPMGRPLRGHKRGASAGVFSLSFSPDSRQLVSGGFDGTIRFWDTLTAEPLPKLLQVLRGRVLAVALSADHKWMASGDAGSRVMLWNRSLDENPATLLGNHEGWVNTLAFSPDSKLLASGGDDKKVRLWSVNSEAAVDRVLEGHQNKINAVAFSPDGKRLVSADMGGMVRLWNSATGLPAAEPVTRNSGPVWDVAFSPDGKRLAIALQNQTDKLGEVWLWDEESERFPDEPLGRHEYSARAVAFCSQNGQLASAGGDNNIRLWDIETGEPLGEPLYTNGIVSDLLFSPNCRWLAAAGQDEAVWLWDMDLRTRACQIANRDLTPDEWQRYLSKEDSYRRTCLDYGYGANGGRTTATD